MDEKVVSEIDNLHLQIIRNNISKFLKECGKSYDKDGLLLDIAPQDHEGAAPYFNKAKIFTLDINPEAKADYTADVCRNNQELIPDNYFDFVVCTEVLEHTLDPFAATSEIYRMLKPEGYAFFLYLLIPGYMALYQIVGDLQNMV